MKKILLFNYKNNFGDDIIISASNHLDLTNYLENELGFKVIEYYEIEKTFGKCYFKQREWEETEEAECYYINKI